MGNAKSAIPKKEDIDKKLNVWCVRTHKRIDANQERRFFRKKHVEIFFYIAEPAYLCIVKKTKRLLDCLG